MMENKLKVNQVETIARGRAFRFTSENVTLPNGATVDMEIVRHPGAAAIIPVTGDGNILMLRQFRYAVGDYILEIPAGTLSGDESPARCAQRELIEETGFKADTWEKIGEITPVPGYSDERVHLFVASDLKKAEANLDEDEIIEVLEIPFDTAVRYVKNGIIQDAKTIVALYLCAGSMERRGKNSFKTA